MAAEGLPTGTVTFLFTDIEGSTPLWETQPGVMLVALERHDTILSDVIASHRGHVFSRGGDAFVAAFADPAHAATAALKGQELLAAERWPEPVEIRVRMGLHTGTAQLRGGDYFGPTLNRAARIASAAHGSQILLSAATAELVRRHLPADFSLVDLGEVRLRGLAHREHVFQVHGRHLASAFPPRTRSLTPTEITARLDDSLRLLRTSSPDVEPRQQSVRATIEWSHNLLSAGERRLFARLALFAGTFDLDAVEQVGAGDVAGDADVIELLVSLVDKSMVVAEPLGETTRYRLLEPLRQYAAERLAEAGEADAGAERHAAHYVQMAVRAGHWYEGTESARGAATFAADWDNLRLALHQSIRVGQPHRVGRLLDACFHYAAFDYRYEYSEWAELAVTMPGVPAVAYAACGYWRLSSDPHGAVELARRGLEASGDRLDGDAALCWFVLGAVHYYTAQGEAAWAEVNRYLDIRQALNTSPFRSAHAAGIVATISTEVHPAAAPAHAGRAVRLAAPLDNPVLDAWLAHVSGLAASAAGDYTSAADHYRRAMSLGGGGVNPLAYTQAAMALALRAPPAERSAAYRETIGRLHAARHATDMWILLESLAAHWATSGQTAKAAVLLGHLEARGYRLTSTAPRRQRALAAVRAAGNADDWLVHGAELSAEQVVAYARRSLDELV